MAGFYGRVTNQSKTSMTFDRVYHNKTAMKANASTDGVFTGRFVLIEYDEELPIVANGNDYASWYSGGTESGNIVISNYTNSFVISKLLKLNTYIVGSKGDANILIEPNPTGIPGQIYKVAMYDTSLTNAFGSYNDATDPDGSLRNLAWTNWVAEHYVDTRYFMVAAREEPITTSENKTVKLEFQDITEFVKENEGAYQTNYNIDRENDPSHNIGRGYDGTVWRKIINSRGQQDYVMLAELNSVVPTFDIISDLPTAEPLKPHFGKDASNVYYPLHLQGNWGLRIAEAEPGKNLESMGASRLENGDTVLSDLPGITYETVKDFDGVELTTEDSATYDGAVYFNKKGFNKLTSTHAPENIKNGFYIEPTGYSGATYSTHNPQEPEKKAVDIQEISVIFPAIGDAVADAYDMLYGVDLQQKRHPYISWDDPNKISDYSEDKWHLVDSLDGTYTRTAPESLSGAINSVHDLMGMIITEEEAPVKAVSAQRNQIYYIAPGQTIPIEGEEEYTEDENGGTLEDGSYWYAAKSVGYDDIEVTEHTVAEFLENHNDINNEEVAGLKNYTKNYYTNGRNENRYVLDKSKQATPGFKYYNLPTRLEYAGAFTNYQDQEDLDQRYFSRSGNGASSYVYTEVPISTVNDPANVGIAYWTFSPELHKGYIIYANNYSVRIQKSATDTSTTGWARLPDSFMTTYRNGGYRTPEDLKAGLIAALGTGVTYDTNYLYFHSATGYQPQGDDYIETNTYKATDFSKFMCPAGAGAYYYTRQTTGGAYTYNNPKSWSNLTSVNNGVRSEQSYYALTAITPVLKWEDNKYVYLTFETDEGRQALDNALEEWNASGSTTNFILNLSGTEAIIGDSRYKVKAVNISRYNEGFNRNENYFLKPTFTLAGFGIESQKNDELESNSQLIKFYTPNTLYTIDHELATNQNYVHVDDRLLYRYGEIYIYDVGKFGAVNGFIPYQKFNPKILTSNADMETFFHNTNSDDNLKIGYKTDAYVWKELPGFARNVNTLHGLLLQINETLQAGDNKTRDNTTVQGAINQVHDVLHMFNNLTPSAILGVNKYGNLDSMSVTGEGGIEVVQSVDDTTGLPKVSIALGAPDTSATPSQSAGDSGNQTPNFGSTFKSVHVEIDNTGRVSNLSEHNVTIPQGSLTDTQASGADVITQLALVSSTGALSTTRTNIGDLVLSGYNISDNGTAETAIAANDTLNGAIERLEYRLNNEITARGNAINALDATVSYTAGTDGLALEATEVDGVLTSISGSIAANTYDNYGAANAVLGTTADAETQNTVYGVKAYAHAAGKNAVLTEYNVPDTPSLSELAILQSKITATDTINQGLEKLEYQLNTEISNRGNAITGITTEIVGTNEDTYEDDTVFGAKAYADHQIENISINYTEDGIENSMSLSELLAYVKQLEARIAALEPAQEEPVINTYHVIYVYDGENLPADVLATLPTDSADYSNNDVITPVAPSNTEIEVDGIIWEFDGWDKASDTINGSDITFTGTWSNNA